MILFILYLCVILLGVYSKKTNFPILLAFVIAWIMIAGNYDNSDYEMYVIRYERGLEVFIDLGFSFLCYLFDEFGFNYFEFKAIISFICLLFIFKTITQLCKDKKICIVCFLIFPLIIDITQFRNFIAYSIVFLAIPYLFKEDKRSTLLYVIIVLIASSIHFMAIFYLVFLMAKFNINKMMVAISIICVFFLKATMKLYFSTFFETEKLDLGDISSIVGGLYLSLVLLINALIILYVYNQNKKRGVIADNSVLNRFSLDNKWFISNFLVLLIIPFLFDNGNYSRILRNIVVLNIAFVSNSYLNRQKKNAIILSYIVFFVYTNYLSGVHIEDVVKPIFINNSII